MRDMILVERVTDGENCHDDCPGRDIRHGLCCGYWPDEQVEERWSEEKAKRCPSCLALPHLLAYIAKLEAVASAAKAHRGSNPCRDGSHHAKVGWELDSALEALERDE